MSQAAGTMTIADVMSREVLAVRTERSLSGAAREMADRRVGSALVVDARGSLVGILTERDVLHAVAHRENLQQGVHASMSEVIATVTPDTPLGEAMTAMVSRRVRHLPVVGADGTLAGIVSMRDLVSAAVCPDVPDRARVGLTAGTR